MDFEYIEIDNVTRDGIKKTIGENLKKLRKKAGLTQEELADRIDSRGEHISKIERGLVEPKIIMIYHICVVLGVTGNELFYGQRIANRMSMGFSEEYAKLRDQQVALVESIVDFLVNHNNDNGKQ